MADLGAYLRTLDLVARCGVSRLYVSAGMPRSGSTLLYNVVCAAARRRHPGGVRRAWIGDMPFALDGRPVVLKTHSLGRGAIWRSAAVFYSYRDVRVALVSHMKRFRVKPSVKIVANYVHEYERARDCADVFVGYEALTGALPSVAAQVLQALGVADPDGAAAAAIAAEAGALGAGESRAAYDPETLLHANHVTGTRDDEWRTALDPALVAEIHDRFAWWFAETGYAVPEPAAG